MAVREFALVIPARYASSRFPGKPLALIAGQSLIRRVWDRCIRAVDPADVFVATDDAGIREHCESQRMQVLMTPSSCLTGTDRVYEASRQLAAGTVLNVQGDEPLIEPSDILKVIDAARRHPGEVINAYCGISEESDFRSPSVPKTLIRPDGRLMYMSRAAVPITKTLEFRQAWKQVCIYAFPPEPLRAFADHGRKSRLEQIEDIEILRFLELGFEVRMIEVSGASIAVDLPEDVARVEAALRERGS